MSSDKHRVHIALALDDEARQHELRAAHYAEYIEEAAAAPAIVCHALDAACHAGYALGLREAAGRLMRERGE